MRKSVTHMAAYELNQREHKLLLSYTLSEVLNVTHIEILNYFDTGNNISPPQNNILTL